MPNQQLHTLIFATFVLLIFIPGCLDVRITPREIVYKQEERFDWSCTPQLPAQLKLHNGAGSITIEAWSEKTVEVNAVKRAATLDDLKSIEASVTCEGGVGELRTCYRKRFVHAYIDYKLKIPHSMHITAKTGSGPILIEGISGDIDVRSSAGHIDILSVRGMVKAVTGNGAIAVIQDQGAHGLIKVDIGSGQVKVKNAHGSAQATTESGAISID